MPRKASTAKAETNVFVSLSFADQLRTAEGATLLDAMNKLDLTLFKVKGVLTVKANGKTAQVPAVPFYVKRLKASRFVREFFEAKIAKIMR